MPYDITMCPGEDCPLRNRCYRFRSEPVGRQDWFGSAPYDRATGTCEQFWDLASLEPTDEQVRTKAYYLWLADGKPEGRADEHWRRAREALRASFVGPLRDEA